MIAAKDAQLLKRETELEQSRLDSSGPKDAKTAASRFGTKLKERLTGGHRGLKRVEGEVRREVEPRTSSASQRETIPIVVVLYHREEDTRRMFEQLARVTDNYSLIIVNNGFDDPEFIKDLKPLYYIKNEENNGAIKPINQGLDLAEGEYVAVLHNDLLIYDEGWLDHIIAFMERRKDVGLVGFAGRHAINKDGSYDVNTTLVKMRDYPEYYIPTWRMTEVATIDGLGWVMRNKGFRLEESFGMMHFYDLDLSLQHIEAGDKVYVAAVDIWHIAEDEEKSSRSIGGYLRAIGSDDDRYYEEVREKFRAKWQNMLPIWRGSQDENQTLYQVEEHKKLSRELRKATVYVRKVEKDWQEQCKTIEELTTYIRSLESELEKSRSAMAAVPPVRRWTRRIYGRLRRSIVGSRKNHAS